MMKLVKIMLLAGVALASKAGATVGGELGKEKRVVRLVAFGDSTTAPRGSIQVYVDCLQHDLPPRGVPIDSVNAGVGGNTTEAGRARFGKDVLDLKPDIVVIQFGINDSAVDVWKTPPATRARVPADRYTANLEFFINTLQAQKRAVILMTPNPVRWTPALRRLYGKAPYRPDDADGFNTILQTYADAVRQVARRKNVPLVDVYAAFQTYGHAPGQSIDDLLLDGMHPSGKGHRLVADLLIKEILGRLNTDKNVQLKVERGVSFEPVVRYRK